MSSLRTSSMLESSMAGLRSGRFQDICGQRCALRANLREQAGQRGGELVLVAVLHRGLKLGVQLVQLGGDVVVDPELPLAQDS